MRKPLIYKGFRILLGERVMGIELLQAPENAYRKGLCGIGNLLVDPWSTHQKSKMSSSDLVFYP